uniref:Ribonuclease UK114 n=1 Tax=Phallusia mammillata TaxID=59560 RepID=A0A6F9DFK6_9ASCI|nr:ribonuclease UK114 [Phallusia mammillata]
MSVSKIVRKVISTTKAPAAIGAYSQAVQVDQTLYVSGQIGLSPETSDFVGSDVESQTEQALKNMGEILSAANMSFADVVKTTVLLADIQDFARVNTVYQKFFKAPYPARAAYAAANLPKLARVEIEAIAVSSD